MSTSAATQHRITRSGPRAAPSPHLALAALILVAAVSLGACGRGKDAHAVSGRPAGEGPPQAEQAPDTGSASAALPAGAQAPVPRTVVEAVRIQPQDFAVTATYIGHLLPRERVELRSEIDGVVESVHFDEGSAVSNGQLLVNISTQQLRVRRDQAQADLRLADSSYKREVDLHTKRLIPESQLDQTRTRRDLARYALQLAEIELDKSQVDSPIDGTVKTRGVNVGEFLNKGQLIAEILDVHRVRALFNVPEREIRFLQPGRTVDVTIEALPGRRFRGAVRLVGLEADTKTRTFPVEVELDNPDGVLRPGMLSRVTVELERYRDQVLIPRHAILERERGRIVYVAEDGKARERTVMTGASSGGNVQVLQGLQPGERLIVTGQQNLTPGEPIRVLSIRD